MVDITKDKYIQKYIEYYKRCLYLMNVDKSLFEKNIKTLKIIRIDDADDLFIGFYDFVQNVIEVGTNPADSIYHELLHLSSTKKNELAYNIGLTLVDEQKEVNVGYGLNEALTEIIDSKYFSKLECNMEDFRYHGTMMLSYILGLDNMVKSYFKGDFNKIEKMIKDTSVSESAIDILTSLDKIYDTEIEILDASETSLEYKKFYTEYAKLYFSSLCQNYLLEIIDEDDLENGISILKKAIPEFIVVGKNNYDILKTNDVENIKSEVFSKILK